MSDAGIYAWIRREEDAGNIYPEVDGYYVWCPTHNPCGHGGTYNEYCLTKMVEYLKAKNSLWHWIINNDPTISGGT